mgnify:CR=1 FL=1
MLVIIGDNETVGVDLRKPIFCFFIKMSDDGVGVEADYHEKVRNLFLTHLLLSLILLLFLQDLGGN